MDVLPTLSAESVAGTGRLLHWAGCQIQPTHRPVVELGFRPTTETDPRVPLDVFISRWYHGSPAQRYGLYALNWIASVNDVETPTIDAFIEATRGLPDGSFVRLKLIGIAAVVYVGWITGIIQAALLITSAGLTTIAGL